MVDSYVNSLLIFLLHRVAKDSLFPEKFFYAYNYSLFCTCPFEWSSKTVSRKLAGVLHDHRGYYWRTFLPGQFAMWNGNWMAELVLFCGPTVQRDWEGFGWLLSLTPTLHYCLAATQGCRPHLWDTQLVFCRCLNKSDSYTALLFILMRKPPIYLCNSLTV